MKYSFLLFLLSLVFSSCFHKSVMESEADNVDWAMVCSENGRDYVVALEEVFQASRKSHEHGVTRISGQTDLRLSVYDLETGELLKRKQIGRVNNEKHAEVLGYADGRLWLYSLQEGLGLHAVHPATLETVVSQEDIYAKNPSLAQKLVTAKYNTVHSFYSFDSQSRRLIFTDVSGFHYRMGTGDLSAEKLDREVSFNAGMMNRFARRSYFGHKADLQGNKLELTGEKRKSLLRNGEVMAADASYLEGHFILDQNEGRLFAMLEQRLNNLQNQLGEITLRRDSITKKYGASLTSLPRDARSDLRELEREERQVARDKDAMERQVDLMNKSAVTFSLHTPLQDRPSAFFVAHRNTLNEDAFLALSKIEDGVERWTTEIDGIFYDPNAARETNAFKVVFSKGNPEFSYRFFDVQNRRLVVFYMLHAFCLDTENGRVLWKKRI